MKSKYFANFNTSNFEALRNRINMDIRKIPAEYTVTFFYVIFSGMYIFWSDWLISIWFKSLQDIRLAQTMKGLVFILITGALLYFLLRHLRENHDASNNLLTRKLHESDRQLRDFLSNLPGMAFRCRNDRSWSMLFVSEGCKKLSGYSSDELINSLLFSYARIIHPQDRRKTFEFFQNNLSYGQSLDISYRIITKSGDVKWVHQFASGVYDENRDLLFIEGLVFDVSDRKELEDRIRVVQVELQQLNNESDLLALNINSRFHDYLQTIGHLTAGIRNNLEHGLYEGINIALQDMALTNDDMSELLDRLQKIIAIRKISYQTERIDMNQLVKKVISSLDAYVSSTNPVIRVEPRLSAVYANPELIEAVLHCLLENALRFCRPGAVPEILIGVFHSREYPVFFIRDNGIGLHPEELRKIFTPFHKSAGHSAGQGLGLFQADQIVKAYGGRIWAESGGTGLGSSFFFSLPAKPKR